MGLFFLCLSSNTSKVLSAFQKNKIKREGKKALKKSRFCLSLSLSLSRERESSKKKQRCLCVCVCVCSNEEKTQRDDDGKRGGGGEEDQENEEESEAMGDVLERGVDDGRDVLRRLLR